MEQYRKIDMGFSTADAQCPEFEYRDDVFRLIFIDWREERIVVEFSEVIAFKWQGDFTAYGDFREDETYEVSASEWLNDLNQTSIFHGDQQAERFKHYKLCFNAQGPFDVICTGYRVKT